MAAPSQNDVTVLKPKKQEQQEEKDCKEKLKNAALYVTEGEKNDKFYRHPKDKDGRMSYYIVHHPAFYMAHLISCVSLMLVALVEKPAVFAIDEDDATRIHIPLEVIFLLLPTIDVILRAFWLRKKFFTHRIVLLALLLFVMFVEAVVVVTRSQNHVRVTRALRPLFFIQSYVMSETRRTLRSIWKCLTQILDVLLVLLFMIAIFALIGYYLFTQTDPDYFSTMGQSYVSLFITLTTANHPDVMLEAYKSNGWSALFFIIFLVITLYLLTSVLLGVVYSRFSRASKHKFKKKFKHQREALKEAYTELTKNGHRLDIITFLKFMREYKPLMPEWTVQCTFKALTEINTRRKKCITPTSVEVDPCRVEGLTIEEFYNLYDALDFKWSPPPEINPPLWKGCHNNLSHWVRPLVETQLFNVALSVVIVANTLFLIIYTAQKVPDGEQPHEVLRGVLWVSFLFVAVYSIEAILKVIAFGYKYFTEFWNLVDFAIIVTSLIMLFLEINPKYCILLFFRPVKLIRLLWLKKRYKEIVETLLFLKEKLISGFILLLVIYYFFAIIGMESFQTKVQHGCCDNNHTWYSVGKYYSGTNNTNVYWLLNFNNTLRSFTTLFVLMVVNNWYIVMEGFAAEVHQQTSVVHHAWLTRLYFVSFYIITLVVLQVMVTFIVDAFAKAQKIGNKRKNGTDKNAAFLSMHWGNCLNCQETKTDSGSAAEQKPCIVEALYETLNVSISDVVNLPEQHPTRWWQCIAHRIRMWRRVDFSSRQRKNGGYICKGVREKDKHCLNVQLYTDKIPKWEKQFEKKQQEGKPSSEKSYGDLLISGCTCSPLLPLRLPLLPQLPFHPPYDAGVKSDQNELRKRTGTFFKGFFEYVFA